MKTYHMTLRHLTMCVLVGSTAAATAAEIDCRAGELKALLGGDAASTTELVLRGEINAADLFFMESDMDALRSVDMSSCTIAAYSGSAVGGSNSWPANTVPAGVFAGAKITSLTFPTVGELFIGEGAFTGSHLASVTLPANTVTVGMGAFAACPELKTAQLTANVKLEGYAFQSCPNLASVDLNGLTTLAQYVFADCPALTEITGAESLTTIAPYSFSDCEALSQFNFGPGLTNIGQNAFSGTSLESVDITSPLKAVEAWAFADCPDLAHVSLPASTESIGQGAFFDCPQLKEFFLPDGCTTVSAYLLKGSSGLDTLNIAGKSTESIGDYALKDAGVSTLTLPEKLESIGTGAMEGMKSLSNIQATGLTAVPALGNDVWDGIDQPSVKLHVNKDIADSFEAAPQWQEFEIIPVLTGVDTPITATVTVRGSYTDTRLAIQSTGAAMTTIEVFDLSGKLVAKEHPQSSECVIPADRLDGDIIIVRCVFDNNERAVLKLAR